MENLRNTIENVWGEHDGNTIIKISTSQQITPHPALGTKRKRMNPL
jgi:hypothetical protein